jgi:hypothetical protein
MILGTIIVFLLVFGICVISYRGALHEFQILQKDYNPENRWLEFLSEQLPLVIRNLPPTWLGNWTKARTIDKDWPVTVQFGEKKSLFKTSLAEWLTDPEPKIENVSEIGQKCKLHITLQNWFRKWFWIPTGSPSPFVLTASPGNCRPLQKTTADSTVIVSTDGSPLEVWISHEAGIPANIVDEMRGKNPWLQSTNEIPGVENVKYIEVKLRPGNAMVIPTHWWYAIRCADESDYSWFWTHEFQSPISWLATMIRSKN